MNRDELQKIVDVELLNATRCMIFSQSYLIADSLRDMVGKKIMRVGGRPTKEMRERLEKVEVAMEDCPNTIISDLSLLAEYSDIVWFDYVVKTEIKAPVTNARTLYRNGSFTTETSTMDSVVSRSVRGAATLGLRKGLVLASVKPFEPSQHEVVTVEEMTNMIQSYSEHREAMNKIYTKLGDITKHYKIQYISR